MSSVQRGCKHQSESFSLIAFFLQRDSFVRHDRRAIGRSISFAVQTKLQRHPTTELSNKSVEGGRFFTILKGDCLAFGFNGFRVY